MKELLEKIKQFDEKSGLKLYQEIMTELFKVNQQLERLTTSRKSWENNCKYWKEKYKKLKEASA